MHWCREVAYALIYINAYHKLAVYPSIANYSSIFPIFAAYAKDYFYRISVFFLSSIVCPESGYSEAQNLEAMESL